jgi:hypothetical protein
MACVAGDAPSDYRVAVVIAHEILGRNAHIDRMKSRFRRYHCNVHTPDLFEDPGRWFRSREQSAAYEYFTKTGGAVAMAARLSEFVGTLRPSSMPVPALIRRDGTKFLSEARGRSVGRSAERDYGHLRLRPRILRSGQPQSRPQCCGIGVDESSRVSGT